MLLGAEDEERIAVGIGGGPPVRVAQVAGTDVRRAHHVEHPVDVDSLSPARPFPDEGHVVPATVQHMHAPLEGVLGGIGRRVLGPEAQHAAVAGGAVAVNRHAPVRARAEDVAIDDDVAVDPVDVGFFRVAARTVPVAGRDVPGERPLHPELDGEVSRAHVRRGRWVDGNLDTIHRRPAPCPEKAH